MAECCCTHSRTTGRKFFLSDDQSPAADSGLFVLLAHSTPAPPTPERHGKGRGRSPPSQAYQGGSRHRSEEHTSELQSLMRISYAVACLKKNIQDTRI